MSDSPRNRECAHRPSPGTKNRRGIRTRRAVPLRWSSSTPCRCRGRPPEGGNRGRSRCRPCRWESQERLIQVCGKPLGCLLVHAIVRGKGTQIAEFLLSESGNPVELFSRCFRRARTQYQCRVGIVTEFPLSDEDSGRRLARWPSQMLATASRKPNI